MAAKKILVPYDFNKLEIQNVAVQNLSSAPSSPVQGQIYYDTSTNKAYIRTNSAWVDLTSPGSAYTGGAGLTLTSSDFSVNVDGSSLEITSDTLNVKALGITNAMLAGSIALAKLATDPLARANHTGTQLAATISDFNTAVRTNRIDQLAAPTAAVSLNSQLITNLTDPISAQDAATKAYVDATASGLDVKKSVRAASTSAGTLATSFENGDTLDGVVLATGNRILIKDQAAGSENGIYVVAASGAPTRATDAANSTEVTGGMFTFVEEGTANADSGWILTNDGAITLNTTALTFSQFSGAGQITAGAGLVKTGNTLDTVGTTNRISIAADSIDISTNYVGQTSITTLGTVTTGVWTGTAIAVANGGTGSTTAAGARTNLGVDIGTNVQAYDATLAALAAFNTNGMLVQTAADTFTARAITGTASRISVTNGNGVSGAPTLDIDSAYVGQTSITTLGTITAGTWTGTAIALANGGTGATTAAGARTNLGATSKYTTNVGDGSSTQITVNHALGTTAYVTQVYESAGTGALVECDVQKVDSNNVKLVFATAPTTNAYTVVVVG